MASSGPVKHWMVGSTEQDPRWYGRYLAEAAGTFIIVLFGDAVIFAGILFGATPDLMTVGLGWGLAVALAVWANGTISGAHFNPGVTLVMALRRKFPWKHVGPYVIAQICGGFIAAAVLQGLFYKVINAKLAHLGLVKGAPGSQLVSMLFVPNVPNPALVGIGPAKTAAALHVPDGWNLISNWQGAAGEFIATALLVIFILVMLDARSTMKPIAWFFPFGLALVVMMLVVIEGPLSMVSLNAARDLGPRIFIWVTGWKSMAFPGPRSDWWVTTIAPTLGAVTAGFFYDLVIEPFLPAAGEEGPVGRTGAALTPPSEIAAAKGQSA